MADVGKVPPSKPSKEVAKVVTDIDLTDLGDYSSEDSRKGMLRLAKAVENSGLVDDEMIKAAMGRLVDESATSLKNALVQMNMASEADILDAVASDLGMERINLNEVNFTSALIDELTPQQVEKYRVIPVKSSHDEIWLALSDPQNLRAIDDLGHVLGKRIVGVIASEDEIEKMIKKYYGADDYASLYEEMAESDDPGEMKDYGEIDIDGAPDEDKKLVVRYVDLIFKQAVHERASDIHIEPTRQGLTIRFRVDGVLHEVQPPPKQWQNAIISRLKVMAALDLAEKRIPLDGRIKLNIPNKKLDLRVSTLPTIYGESIVMRILDASSVMMGLEDVGFLPDTVRQFNDLIRRPNGVILMTGPTGSGKTTTLYAALGVLNTPEHKIVTLEDPVEYQIPGINQVQITPEVGLTFPVGLRALLRQSPDVILVGEIRDLETGENAIRAALTGHLVFSTLHTNDAPSSTIRLIDLGIKPYLVASSVQAIIAQRLVRRICGNCKKPYRPKPEEFVMIGYEPDQYKDIDLFEGEGCERCNKSGYRGRTAIHEVFVLDAEIRRRVIRIEASSRLKRYAVSKGMRTLRMDGFEKVILGQTSIEEVVDAVGGED
jgi:type IV pilus assembly protein PilB